MEENSKTDLNVFLSIYWSRISLENSWYQAVDKGVGTCSQGHHPSRDYPHF